jgi:nicotinamide mononucleotide transporter
MTWSAAIASYAMSHGLELAAMAATVLGIWLTTRRLLICWPITLLADLLYLVVFFRAHLFSDTLLQIFFIVFTLYGWWHWWRGMRQEGEVRIAPLSGIACAAALGVGVVGAALLGSFMIWIGAALHVGIALPHLDAALTSFSLVASWWQARKHIANWWLWIAVDAIYVGEYIYKDLWPTALLYAGLIALAVLGLYDWRRAETAQTAACTALSSGSPAM